MMFRMNHRECSAIRARRAAQRRIAIATIEIITIVILAAGWMVLQGSQ